MKAYEFFGTLPGLLTLAAVAVLFILISVIRRLRARSGAVTEASPEPPKQPSSEIDLSRWLAVAVAAYLASETSPAPSAESWRPALDRLDPWMLSQRKIGVYK